MMTREQAIEQMMHGKKVQHMYFSDHEFITMKDPNTIITTEGYEVDAKEFWHYRSGKSFDQDWHMFPGEEPVDEVEELKKRAELERQQLLMFGNPYTEIMNSNDFKAFCNEQSKPLKRGYYSDIRRTAKIGRNEPCLCGSGNKYKQCCINKT